MLDRKPKRPIHCTLGAYGHAPCRVPAARGEGMSMVRGAVLQNKRCTGTKDLSRYRLQPNYNPPLVYAYKKKHFIREYCIVACFVALSTLGLAKHARAPPKTLRCCSAAPQQLRAPDQRQLRLQQASRFQRCLYYAVKVPIYALFVDFNSFIIVLDGKREEPVALEDAVQCRCVMLAHAMPPALSNLDMTPTNRNHIMILSSLYCCANFTCPAHRGCVRLPLAFV